MASGTGEMRLKSLMHDGESLYFMLGICVGTFTATLAWGVAALML